MGESAGGAIIMSENIEYNHIMDDKSIASELDDYAGLNVFDHYVLPHIGEYPFEETAQKTLDTYQDKISLVPINNNEAILVNDNGYTVLNESK
nr:Type 1 glutamine amidotransferase-like domain-containing protein [Veillonella denticariosi]